MNVKCAISKIEVSPWKPKVLCLIYYLTGNGAKDRVMIWYPEHRYQKLRDQLEMFCAPIQKVALALQHVPTQFFLNELNFDSIEFTPNQFGFDTVVSHYKGKHGHDNDTVTDTQLHF